ncbi:MAG TPA: response regulator [Candidatus Limnocylindrales bacterium]
MGEAGDLADVATDDRHRSSSLLRGLNQSNLTRATFRIPEFAHLLERHCYTVLRAATGEEAVNLARRFSGRIDLLFSDMVMPGLTGYQTAVAVKALRPDIRQLFASGYCEELHANRISPETTLPFIEKPYGVDALLLAVRDVLAAE